MADRQIDPALMERYAEDVHNAWMATKRAQGVESRPSEWGEEQMVPYAALSERAKDLDRGTVRAVLAVAGPTSDEITRRMLTRMADDWNAKVARSVAGEPHDCPLDCSPDCPGWETGMLARGHGHHRIELAKRLHAPAPERTPTR